MTNFCKTGKYPAQLTLSILHITVILLSSFHVISGAKILFYLGIGSHRVAIQPLITKLSERGHDITVLSPFKPEIKNPQIKEFCPQSLLDFSEKLHKEFGNDPVVARQKDKHFDQTSANGGASTWDLLYITNEITATSSEFLSWLANSTFDLVVTEHAGKELAFVLAHKKGAKVIAISPAPLWAMDADLFGFPTEASWYSGWLLGSPYRFIPDHFFHEWNALRWYWKYTGSYLPRLDELVKTNFGENIPKMEDLIRNIDLYFINTHFSSEYARSLPPFVVPVGGMHVQTTSKPLPKNLEDFISSGSEGFVFISFGSVAQISGLPQETQTDFFSVLATFKDARFLLKWNGEVPEDMPKNIIAQKWFPQQDLLAHPKIRGFVSQGGLMSFQQATYFGVPVIIMPIFGDQPFNAKTSEHLGNGIHLELADLTFETFSDAMKQLLYNQELATQAKEVSKRFKDRPMTPTDTAVWWTEYVLRHNDTSDLKPLGIHRTWWQRRLLDFWAPLLIVIILCRLILFVVFRSLIRILWRNRNYFSRDKVKRS